MTSIYSQQALDRLLAVLESSPTGLALLNGITAVPITDAPLTETLGVAQGQLNIYRDGTNRWLQIFDMEGDGAPAWFKVEATV